MGVYFGCGPKPNVNHVNITQQENLRGPIRDRYTHVLVLVPAQVRDHKVLIFLTHNFSILQENN